MIGKNDVHEIAKMMSKVHYSLRVMAYMLWLLRREADGRNKSAWSSFP
jgi:hypothetical protein